MESASFRSLQSRLFELYAKREYRKALGLLLAEGQGFPDQEGRIGYWFACLYCCIGQLESAIHVLQDNLDRGHWWSEERMLTDEDLDPLRERPDFRAIVAKCATRRIEAQKHAKPDLIVRIPPGVVPPTGYPIVLALHGRDGRASMFAPYWEECTAHGWLLSVPTSSQILSPDGFGWDDVEAAERDVAWAFESTSGRHPIDPGRIVLAGFSQGGALAIRMALKGNLVPASRFVAVAPSPVRAPPEVVESWFASGARRGVRGWILAGERDYARAQSAELHDRIVAAGLECGFTIEPNLGHEFPADFAPRLISALNQ